MGSPWIGTTVAEMHRRGGARNRAEAQLRRNRKDEGNRNSRGATKGTVRGKTMAGGEKRESKRKNSTVKQEEK